MYIIENINCPENHRFRQFEWEYCTQHATEREIYIIRRKVFFTMVTVCLKPDANIDQKPKGALFAMVDQSFSGAYLYQHSNIDSSLIKSCGHQEPCKL